MVSSDFGKLEVHRHFSSGIDCAIAGIATAVAAVAAPVSPAALRNSRRFMVPSGKSSLLAGAMRSRTVTLRYHDPGKGGILKIATAALFAIHSNGARASRPHLS
jgi:hypothetical protein